jgi:hypothetical protein
MKNIKNRNQSTTMETYIQTEFELALRHALRHALIKYTRDCAANQSKKVAWGDDESEMDFSQPIRFQDDDMDVSE